MFTCWDGHSPNWMTQMPVPVPISSTVDGEPVMGVRASLPSRAMTNI